MNAKQLIRHIQHNFGCSRREAIQRYIRAYVEEPRDEDHYDVRRDYGKSQDAAHGVVGLFDRSY